MANWSNRTSNVRVNFHSITCLQIEYNSKDFKQKTFKKDFVVCQGRKLSLIKKIVAVKATPQKQLSNI